MDNNKIADGIASGDIQASLDLGKYVDKDEKVKKLHRGMITITDFVRQIVKDDPYAPVFLYHNAYRIQGKDTNIPPESHVSPEELDNLYHHYKTIIGVYPELKEFLTKQGCTSCSKRVNAITVLNCMVLLGGIDRDIYKMSDFLPELFLSKLKQIKPNKALTIDMLLGNKPSQGITRDPVRSIKPKAEHVQAIGKNSLVRQCMDCTKEHIAKAIGLLLEYKKDPNIYITHFWRAIGQLGLAEVECIELDYQMSQQIRNEKRSLLEDHKYIPNLEQFFLR